ncbi:MAG: hypothetical protein ACR2JF_18585 [Iamia sp.]
MTEPLDGPPLDLRRVLDVLARHGVDYILVGGVAANAYGATRPTLDFDCVPRRDATNLSNVAAALRELNARLRVGGLSDAESSALPIVIDAKTIEAMEISTWMTDAGGVDVLRDIPRSDGTHQTYMDLLDESVTQTFEHVRVRLVGLDHLIGSKEWADRPKDHDALPEIRRLRDRHLERGPDIDLP